VPVASCRSSTEVPDLWLPRTRADVRRALPRGTRSGPPRRGEESGKLPRVNERRASSGAGTGDACGRGQGGVVEEGGEEASEGEKAMGSSSSWWFLEGAGRSVEEVACVGGARPATRN
jgi:hypothetical protein